MNEVNLKQVVPFFMVTDMDRSIAFYVDGLGFELKTDWRPRGRIEWCYLEREGVALMLQEYREGLRPMEKPGVGVSICFICQDALKLYTEFLKKELQPKEPFVGNNMWVTSIGDPDGYKLDFESPTEVAEETKYRDWIDKK
ncbi:MAG: VOC family protein [Cyclobacteriaceae bacterium]|nr:VOC family protein [Cyclobacteriaceae bacterium]